MASSLIPPKPPGMPKTIKQSKKTPDYEVYDPDYQIDEATCLICVCPLLTERNSNSNTNSYASKKSPLTPRGFSSCGHDDICALCHIRMRHLHGNGNCPICRTNEDNTDDKKQKESINNKNYPKVIVDDLYYTADNINEEISEKPFESYSTWGEEDLGPNFYYDERVRMFFRKGRDANTRITWWDRYGQTLFYLQCGICGWKDRDQSSSSSSTDTSVDPSESQFDNNSNNLNSVRNATIQKIWGHSRRAHNGKTFCYLCAVNNRDFFTKLEVFDTAAEVSERAF